MSIPKGTCICIQCNEEKDNIEYPYMKNRKTKKGFYTRNNKTCKECIKYNNSIIRDLRKNHERPELGTPCECCERPIVKYNDFQLDHDHINNCFRGWICRKCNTGMGNLGDTEESLIRALKYLRKNKRTKIIKKTWRVFKNKKGEVIKRILIKKVIE